MAVQSAANTPIELFAKLLKSITDIKIACAELGPSAQEDLAFLIQLETQILQRFGREKMNEMSNVGAPGQSPGGGMAGMGMGGGPPSLPSGPAMGFSQSQGPPVDEMRRVLSR
jgi:hypothetical protein